MRIRDTSSVSNEGTTGHVIADAVQFLSMADAQAPETSKSAAEAGRNDDETASTRREAARELAAVRSRVRELENEKEATGARRAQASASDDGARVR